MANPARFVLKLIQNPAIIYFKLNKRGLLDSFSDEKWIRCMWKAHTGKKIDLENPVGFNEKLQWIKLHDRRPEYTRMVDKYEVRQYIADTIGEEHLIPLLGVWDRAEDIDFDALPDEFVLKCNHNSGEGMCFCKDKASLDTEKVRAGLARALKKSHFLNGREWPYKNVKPRIIAERFMHDPDPENTAGTLVDYKFCCFNGEPRYLYISVDDISEGKKGKSRLMYLDMDWNPAPFYRAGKDPVPFTVKKPSTFDEMAAMARKLSAGIPFVRVDLYSIDGMVYFSELTFFTHSGFAFFKPDEWERRLGDMITLPEKTE